MDELSQLIAENPDPRELKRAVAVQMRLRGYTYQEIEGILQVSAGFISQWQQAYQARGIRGLRLSYQGAASYLDETERQAVIDWLKQKNYWHLPELQQHLEDTYNVVFQSKQSYYALFQSAGLSWKKSQKRNPKQDQKLVEKKREIMAWLSAHRAEIETGQLAVFMLDECHLLWGDLCGYVWGKTSERVEVPIVSEREKQTYYGALNYRTQEFWVQAYEKGNTDSTIAFLNYLQAEHPSQRLAVIWDGASYHRSGDLKAYLEQVNRDLEQENWQLTCILMPLMPQSKIQLKIFGYKPNGEFENSITCASLLMLSKSCLNCSRIVRRLIFQNCMNMGCSLN